MAVVNRPVRHTVSARLGALGLAVCLGVGLGACTSPTSTVDESASDVVASLGAVPIPPEPTAAATPSASPGHPQVLAMGAPVDVTLAGGARATVTARGPEELSSFTGGATAPTSSDGLITLELAVRSGSITVASSDLSSRDETGKEIPLAARGSAPVTAAGGQITRIQVRGTYASGSAQVTWRNNGSVLAIWVFTIELD